MINISVVCVGRLKEDYLRRASAEYEKRLVAFCRLKITEIAPSPLPENPSPAEIKAALSEEGGKILSKIPSGDAVYALCVEGKPLSSMEFSEEIEKRAVSGFGGLSFVVGGPFGLAPSIKNRANLRLSMGPMTFPHRLARIMLLEQIYRAFMILSGGKYHK